MSDEERKEILNELKDEECWEVAEEGDVYK